MCDIKLYTRIGDEMRLVTFQSFEAIKDLFNKGYLECNKDKINMEKVGYAYSWIVEKMNQKI